ncbi:hypothetical protein [Halosimplex amylolyticum]|uniref:hypothetical protein n=1 Tax=Halosimplex amylolyticum TaxID=3396616 RepID=UPI003F555951
MNRPGALLAGTAVNVPTLAVLLATTDVVLLGTLAGGVVAGLAVGELRDGALVGGAAALLAPPVGAALAVVLTVVALAVGVVLGSGDAAWVGAGAIIGTIALGPVLGLASLLVYFVSLLVLVPLGVVGGVAGALAAGTLVHRR